MISNDDAERTWRELTALFATWKVLAPGAWMRTFALVGNDLWRPVRRSGEWRKALTHMDAPPIGVLRHLEVIAQQNLRRHLAFFRVLLALYFTVPASVLIGVNELYPDTWAEFDLSLERGVLIQVGVLVLVSAVYFAGLWRARAQKISKRPNSTPTEASLRASSPAAARNRSERPTRRRA